MRFGSVSLYVFCHLHTFISAARLTPRSARPSPISIPPSQNWDGDDGPWSSFTIQVGTPTQNVRVFISSILSETWVIRSDGCTKSQSTCKEDRGRTFDPSVSTTWKQHGDQNLAINQNIGPYFQGVLGNETLGLGLQGSGGPVLHGQAVAAYTSQELNMGMFGANALSMDPGERAAGFQNYLTTLKNQSMIPSLSFGYTAGNQYRLKKVYGSLTLGGYDASLFKPNSLTIPFSGTDPSRCLQVTIQGISAKDQSGKTSTLLPQPVTANVDSTNSMIWLPEKACKAFEDTFGLTFDEKSDLYLVNDELHTKLQEQNASITFTLSNLAPGGEKAEIVLPYKSFELMVKPPYAGISSNQPYFPLRRAANTSQITLGRTFLQEAYLTVDWDRRNFSISQCNFTDTPKPNLVSIYTPGEEPKSELSNGVKIGIGLSIVIGVLLLATLVTLFILRRRRARRRAAEEAAKTGINPKEGLIRQGLAKGEMSAGIEHARYEMEGSDGNALKPYGGRNPPWVDEKAAYPGLGFTDVAEIDGAGQRAELGGAVGFYGGRGVHEMYDPSSVPPIELPASSAEAPSRRGELEGSSTGVLSPRSPLSRVSWSSQPSPIRSSIFGVFSAMSRRSRVHSGATERLSSAISGPSVPSSPKHAERAFGSRGQAHLISIHRGSARSTTSGGIQTPNTPEIPPLPTHDFNSLSRPQQHHRSVATGQSAPSNYSSSNVPPSARFSNQGFGSLSGVHLSQPSVGQRSSGPSALSSPSSPHYGSSRRNRRGSQVSAPSSGNGNEVFSPISRRATNDVLSPISPDEEVENGRRGV